MAVEGRSNTLMTQPFSITGNDVGPQHQRVRYELSVLAFRLPDADKAAAGILPWVADPDAHGELLGCWETEHGPLGRLIVLRGFADDTELARGADASTHQYPPIWCR
jgi:hypothetical protein